MSHEITVAAPINIAFIKYWGKRAGGEELILPTNDSFSITLSTKPFRSKTSVLLTDKLASDVLILNGEKVDFEKNPRLVNVMKNIRATSPAELAKLKVFVVSENNFPTAAGMASSASGYCALSAAIVRIFQSTTDVSLMARIGSGSACRSAYGGFVKWLAGTREDGTDAIAEQFVDEKYWPEVQVLCAVVKGHQKDVSSTKGMQLSLQTSPMMPDRIATIVPQRMVAVAEAIKKRDFETFATIAMTDSDDLQAVCATTVPKIQYATDDSYTMIALVKAYNAAKGKTVLGYTFDAGANCFLFTLRESLAEVVAVVLHYFPTAAELCAFNDEALLAAAQAVVLAPELTTLLPPTFEKHALTYFLHSPVGSGPQVLDASESLLTKEARLRAKEELLPGQEL